MNPNEYEQFILRLYNAGENNTDAIKEMHSFVKEPGSLQIILDSISSHQISRTTLLISLSCIPNVYMTTLDDSVLRSWFENFIFKEAESLLSDDFIALLVNVFHFTYRNDLKEGSLLIQELSNGSPPQRILAIQISLQIIEKFQKVTNLDHLISMSVLPFTDAESSPQLIDSAALLMKQLLIYKGSSDEIKSILLSEVNEIFPQRIFSCLFNFQEEPEFISVHLLELFNTFLSLKPAVFKIQDFRKFFVDSSIRLFFDYTKKMKFSEQKIPVLCSSFIALRNSFSCLLHEDSLTIDYEGFTTQKRQVPQKVPSLIFDSFIENACGFALFILSENSYLRYLELVLDFWINNDNRLIPLNQKTFDEKVLEILDAVMQKFFTVEVLDIEGEIGEIIDDKSSLLIQKLADFACFQIDSVCERVCEFLVEELALNNIEISAFVIEFLAFASEKVKMDSFRQIVLIIFDYQLQVEPHSSVSFELSLIQFFRVFLKRFEPNFSDQLRNFFIRFMVDIQTESASIEIIQEVINVLQCEWMKDERISIIASNEEAFDLITRSQLISSPSFDQPKKVTTIVFKVAFQIGFFMPNPDQVISLIESITNRINSDPNDSVAYLMMAGGFLSPNCKFENLYSALSTDFFHLLIKRMEELVSFLNGTVDGQIDASTICTNPKITIDVLHLFDSISSCFCEKSKTYLSNNVIDFSELTLRVLNLALNASESMDKESVDYLKIISNVSIILSNLLLNKALNFGIIEYYKNTNFQETLLRMFDVYLLISFDAFAQNSKLIDKYLCFIKTVIGEYLTFMISIDSILIQHHLQILIFIFDLNAPHYSVEAAKILTSFATSLYAFEIPEIEQNCMSVMKCVIQSAFNLVIKNGSTDKISSELIYSFLMNFQRLRDEFFDGIADKIESVEMNDKMHFIFSSIKFSFYEIDEKKSFDSFRNLLGCLIKTSRECGIDLSTPDLLDDDDEANE